MNEPISKAGIKGWTQKQLVPCLPTALARTHESEGCWFKSQCRPKIFPRVIFVKFYLQDHLGVQFVHLWQMYSEFE